MSTPSLTVIVCPAASAASVTASAPGFWGAPVLSAYGLAKWGVWDSALSDEARAAVLEVRGVQAFPSNDAANLATGWIDQPRMI